MEPIIPTQCITCPFRTRFFIRVFDAERFDWILLCENIIKRRADMIENAPLNSITCELINPEEE